MSDDAIDALFTDESLISPDVSKALPEGYKLRSVRRSDRVQFLDILRVLTTVGDISEDDWSDRFNWLQARNDSYFILCITDENGDLAAVGSLIVEKKFIHNCGSVGHIEDITVAKDKQGKSLGLRIIHALDHIAQQRGCYKCILDCDEKNEGFYIKCGYKRAGLEMSKRFDS